MLTKYFNPIHHKLLVLLVEGGGGGTKSLKLKIIFVSIVCLLLVWFVPRDVTRRQFYDHFMQIM